MRCIVCSKPAGNTINCARHSIEISLCNAHVNECNKCDECRITLGKVKK